MKRVHLKQYSRTIAIYLVLIGITLIMLFPLIWVISSSVKTLSEIFNLESGILPKTLYFGHYQKLVKQTAIIRYLLNTLAVAIAATFLSVVFASFSGYGLSRFKSMGLTIYGQSLLFFQAFPGVLTLLSLFVIMRILGLLDSLFSVILTYTAFSLPFSIWMARGFFDSIPVELEEAAAIDGCTKFKAFLKIVLPLSAPGLGAIAIFTFLLCWNEYMFASVFLRSNNVRTLSIGIAGLMAQYQYDWGAMLSAANLATFPALLFVLIMQKYLIQGLTAGALKG